MNPKKRNEIKRLRKKKFARLKNIGQIDNYYLSKRFKIKKEEHQEIIKYRFNFFQWLKKIFLTKN